MMNKIVVKVVICTAIILMMGGHLLTAIAAENQTSETVRATKKNYNTAVKPSRVKEPTIDSTVDLDIGLTEPITKLKVAPLLNEEESSTLFEEVLDAAKPAKTEAVKDTPDLIPEVSNEQIELKKHMNDEKSSPYVIAAGNTVKITIFGENDLSGDYKVAGDGTIAMPLIGPVLIGNKTIREAEDVIATFYKDGYLKDPSVSVEVEESKPFFILGEVRRPGSYNYIGNMNILQAIAISGGFTYRANQKSVDVLRGDMTKSQSIPVTPKTILQAGDIIFVKERFF